MARLFTSGYETGGTTEWTSNGGSPVIQTITLRDGNYAGQITNLQSTVIQGWHKQYASANGNTFYNRLYINITAYPSADNTICCFTAGTSIASAIADTLIKLSSTGTLKLFDAVGPTQVGSASSILSLNTWYRVEHEIDLSGGAGAQVLEGKLEGSAFATSTTDSGSSPVKAIMIGGNLLGEAQTTGTWYLDDIAVNDGTLSANNTYPGTLPQSRSAISMYLKQGFQ